ncbi:MAG: hypothetical protein RBS39_06775 [Phycisphaerales bacterium]|jgi:hypothetical protein|nr:hypothetical protein [Phycisphaerales bacterium]
MSSASPIDTYKPGQTLACTVAKRPMAQRHRDTIERLMWLDPDNKKSMKHAYDVRQRRLNVYNRGNRDWTSREKAARVVSVEAGATFSLPYNHDLANDLASISQFLTIK